MQDHLKRHKMVRLKESGGKDRERHWGGGGEEEGKKREEGKMIVGRRLQNHGKELKIPNLDPSTHKINSNKCIRSILK